MYPWADCAAGYVVDTGIVVGCVVVQYCGGRGGRMFIYGKRKRKGDGRWKQMFAIELLD